MKKTLIALMAMAGVAMADSSYTWDAQTSGAVLGGTVTGAIGTGQYTPNQGSYINSEALTVITGASTYGEDSTKVLYDMINDAIAGKSLLTFSGDISVGTTTSNLVILHAGRADYGLTLGIKGGDLVLTNTGIGGTAIVSIDMPLNSKAKNEWYLTNYSITIGKGGVVTYSVNGGTESTATTNFTANWYTGSDNGGEIQNHRYSFGHKAPGWNEETFGGNFHTTGLTITSVSVPEPTTATLSLLALAGLAARRRRK